LEASRLVEEERLREEERKRKRMHGEELNVQKKYAGKKKNGCDGSVKKKKEKRKVNNVRV
jgi:hypothetical protein